MFFFTSRRRHTRSLCDWSSDVCSSDLRQQRDLLPSFENTYEMYEAACSYLGSRGFRQATLYDWERIESEAGRFFHEKAERYQYEEKLREFFQKETEGGMGGACNMVGNRYAGISGCM